MSKKAIKDKLVRAKERSYLNKDFDGFRADLLQYAQTYFPDDISDFSDPSLGGLFLDMAAYVGDVMSYYLDHQFTELDVNTASEEKNIARIVESAGVRVVGPSPAFVDIKFSMLVTAKRSGGKYIPREELLPTIKAGTRVTSQFGIVFELLEDLNFAKKDPDGDFMADFEISSRTPDGKVDKFSVSMIGPCSSSLSKYHTVSMLGGFVQFPTVILPDTAVTDVLEVSDSEGNKYYEVEYLTQDTVFKRVLNTTNDHPLVSESIELIPAPRRYISRYDRITRKTTLTFGAGNENTLDDDIVPDPSELALPLYGKKTMKRFSIDPNKMLETRTLGIAPQKTTLTIRYRVGGGLNHNVPAGSIKTTSKLLLSFEQSPGTDKEAEIRGSITVKNNRTASGGEEEPTLEDLKTLVKTFKTSQSRIVTKEDLIARVYTMPSEFGRVFRLSVKDNPANPLAARLYIISRDRDSKLVTSPDMLKKNLRAYLNQYRLVSDAVDILDAEVINLKIAYEVILEGSASKPLVLQEINGKLKKYLNIKYWQIDQPLLRTDLFSIISDTQGVVSVSSLKIRNISGNTDNREYSSKTFNVKLNTLKKMIIPPPGSIFEIRYPDFDIVGIAQ